MLDPEEKSDAQVSFASICKVSQCPRQGHVDGLDLGWRYKLILEIILPRKSI